MSNVYALESYINSANGRYKKGESVCFFPFVFLNDQPVREGSISWVLLKNNEVEIAKGEVDLDTFGAAAKGTLHEPGFLECQFTYTDADGSKHSTTHAASFSSSEIRASTPTPDDFDAFWDQQKEKLAQIPLNYKMTQLPSENIDLFDVTVDSVGGTPVSGYYAKPKKTEPQSLPIIILPHGAGTHSARVNLAIQLASMGFLAFDINAHGILNSKDAEYYQQQSKNELVNYRHQGFNNKTPDDVYFTGMFLRAKRSVDFMTDQPEWDHKNVFFLGSSQGALQSFAGAYLDKRVTAIGVSVPAGSDLTGSLVNRATGWPDPHLFAKNHNYDHDTVMKNVRYFDNINFAAKLEIPALFTVGFVDGVCKPSTVYSVYNNYKGPKNIIERPRMGHVNPREIQDELMGFLMSHIR